MLLESILNSVSYQQTTGTTTFISIVLFIQICSPILVVQCNAAWIVPERVSLGDIVADSDDNINNEQKNLWYNLATAEQQDDPTRYTDTNIDQQNSLPIVDGSYSSSGRAIDDLPQNTLPDFLSVLVDNTNKIQQDAESSEVYLLEDKDYPTSLYEHYNGVGSVSGITALPNDDVAIFHRANRTWDRDTFDENHVVKDPRGSAQDNLIKDDTIVIIDSNNGSAVTSLGSNLFYMPHGIASDSLGNLWITDVARHQVMRLPTASMLRRQQQQQVDANDSSDAHESSSDDIGNNVSDQYPAMMKKSDDEKINSPVRQLWPDIIIGEAFVPGNDTQHFCKPSEVVVSSDGRLIFVADGYCNKRVMVFTGTGKYMTSFGEEYDMEVVHSLTLLEEKNLLFVADRETGRILAFNAGLDDENANNIGRLVSIIDYPIGKVYAITTIGPNHLLVSSNQIGNNHYDLAALDPFKRDLKFIWTSTDLTKPHSLTHTRDGHYAYAADLDEGAHKKVFKFDVIQRAI